jgi:NAD(P)-dependent dehydrogenase (short-subunit alcohol dehydrogenase family)
VAQHVVRILLAPLLAMADRSEASGEAAARVGPEPNGRLHGKVAVVTGAARGIGREVAVAFAREGAAVVGLDAAQRVSEVQRYEIPSENDLNQTGRMVEECGSRWQGIVADIRDLSALRDAADRIVRQYLRIDVLAAIAGIQSFASLLDMGDAEWDDQIDVNLTGTANSVRAVAPIMARQKSGRIIITSSTQGRHGMRDGSAYSASKWGLFGLAKSAALELGEFGITVNVVVPGLMDTPLTRNSSRYKQAMLESKGKVPSGDLEAKVIAEQQTKTPLGVPWIEPRDIAAAYVFLASDEARMMTGATLDVTAGDSAHNLG